MPLSVGAMLDATRLAQTHTGTGADNRTLAFASRSRRADRKRRDADRQRDRHS